MKVVAILQARMGSTRLPGKVMLPLAGKPMLQNIIERVQRATRVHEVMVTCPIHDREAFLPVMQACRNGKTFLDEWFEDENDLVGRYLQAAIRRDADIIVRVPCDNPCVDPAYIDEAVQEWFKRPYHFYSNTTGTVDYDGGFKWYGFDGLGCEIVSMSTMKWLDIVTSGKETWREHPHKYWEDFNKETDSDQPEWSIKTASDASLRLDVNTQDDYEFISSIYNYFGHNRFTSKEILACPPVQERLHGR